MAQDMDKGLAAPPIKTEDAVANDTDLAIKVMEVFCGGRIVTLPEPVQRSRSYRELILQEMNWMASDYYHERRWKMHAGRQISIGIKEAVMDRKRLNKNWVANECSNNVKRFWAGVIKNASHNHLMSKELSRYCMKISGKYNKYVQTDIEDTSKDYEIGAKDLIAITVPLVPLRENAPEPKAPMQKTDVIEVVALRMQSMGAELYRPLFRPPDDELDMFTMPLMDPARDNDFNALLVQNFCIKRCADLMSRSHARHENRAPHQPVLTRKFNRVTNDPNCLAISLRDFDLQIKPKALFEGLMVKSYLTPADFELLDSWMLTESASWQMLAICLTYRSSASGLYRYEYDVDYCKRMFASLKRPPRGLVNSSRRLLGPRQRNAITTFLDAPPRRHKFEPLVTLSDNGEQTKPSDSRHRVPMDIKEVLSCCNKSTQQNFRQKRKLTSKLEDKYLAHRKSASTYRDGPDSYEMDVEDAEITTSSHLDNDKHVATNTGILPKGHKGTTSVNMEINNVQINFPLSDLNVKDLEGLPVTFLQNKNGTSITGNDKTQTRGTIVLEKVDASDIKKAVIVIPKNARVEVAIASGKHKIPPCYRSDRKTDPVLHMSHIPYGEYSNRMSKQLRVGFLGIPAKMFAHSLFYSGRFSKNNRVRRVAVTIANATKTIMPQPNILYARLFEHDAVSMFARFRSLNWQRSINHAPGTRGEQLLKRYTAEVIEKKGKPPAELKLVEILAAYVDVKLARGERKRQTAFLPNKIPLKNIEQVVQNAQVMPIPPQAMMQQRNGGPMPMQHMPLPGHNISPMPAMQPAMMPQVMHMGPMQNMHMPMHPPMPQGPMPPPPNPAVPMHHMPMMPGGMKGGSMPPGSMNPGQMGPMKMPAVPIPPGSLAPGHMTPGGMHPGQMTPGKAPPGTMPGMPPPMQMNMEQMKRRPPMDMAGKRRPIMPYEQMYQPQAQGVPYRYRPMPDANMMRMRMYPMPMYSKQVPYPKAHEDPYRAPPHMQR
ncbi:HSA family protein, putative [Babesia ovis]|uniref:HSA family protein, putative n=1 Tax=Babesia ovis TaxID=5869 RepID=A0A9W5TDM3_BABOV|nr:HSA family protein, putative [Babesia ovis]